MRVEAHLDKLALSASLSLSLPLLAFSPKRLNGLKEKEGSDDFIGCGIVGRRREVKTTAALKIFRNHEART